jgi:HK97 family phage portal protein
MIVRAAQGLLNAAWRLTHRKALPLGSSGATNMIASGSGGWWPIISESFSGAWQRNIDVRVDNVLTYSAVFACISLIQSDIAKLRLRLVEQNDDGIWDEVIGNSPYWPVLRKPNHYQNRIQFFANWIESKLVHGNVYVLKERDQRGIVTAMYILNPLLVSVLVAPNGDVYYQLRTDLLSGVREESTTVPAREIIHDRYTTTPTHPLIGVSPITACGLAATQGLKIQENSASFFSRGANPGGVLTAPAKINDETAKRIKTYWDENYGSGGPNVGKVAVLGDGLKYEPMMMTAVDAQLIEQLKMTAETVASVFHVPAYLIGVGTPPTYNNSEILLQMYYSQCLQIQMEQIELALDEGIELGKNDRGLRLGTEFDKEDLLLLDTKTRMEVVSAGVQRGIFSPDEGRLRFNMKPVPGGATPYMQEQNWPLAALAGRDLPTRPPTAPEEIPADVNPAPTPDNGQADRAAIAAQLKRSRSRVRAAA